MSKPLRITCNNIAEIPSATQLRQLATPNQHVVLQFPLATVENDFDKYAIIESLTPQLPNYRVFDSGKQNHQTLITIKKVLDQTTILDNRNVFTQAIERFLNLADELLLNLAQKYGVSVSELQYLNISKNFTTQLGDLDEQWIYFFHGYECRFENKMTGQIVDITLQQTHKRYVRVDPFFFGEYVHTSPQEQETASFIKDKFHDSLQILEVLSENGYLVD